MSESRVAITAQLDAFEANVRNHVAVIVGAAGASPPGGNGVWDRVLAHYGESPEAPLKRLEDVASAGQVRGATTVELRRALEAMVRGACTELDRIADAASGGRVSAGGAVTGDADLDARLATDRALLSRLTESETSKYIAAVSPPRHAVAASVGSVFANAQATAKQAPWANVKVDPSRVLQCAACGAPQEVALDFVCRYCRSPMGKIAK